MSTITLAGSVQEILAMRVPPLMAGLLPCGGPTDEQFESARAFSTVLGSRGDILLFPSDIFKDQVAAEEIMDAFCQHVAVCAYCPGGITCFGLHLEVRRGEMIQGRLEQGCSGMFPADSKGEKKKTGSFYTPVELIDCLLDSALDPILDEACAQPDPAKAILQLTMCDPACGSGAFPIAAAERMARRLALVRYGTDEPGLTALRECRRAIVSRCIYAVDLNPAAVELCKLTLCLQAIDPTKPFPFLDIHVQCGNAILGATPRLLKNGIPDSAFEAIEGDDKKTCAAYRKQNKAERAEQQGLFADETPSWAPVDQLLTHFMEGIDALPDDTIEAWHFKRFCSIDFLQSDIYQYSLLRANAWCAAFVWKKTGEFPTAITERVFRDLERDPASVPDWMRKEIERLARQYQFFHWHLAFPQVMRAPGMGGAKRGAA